MKYPKRIRKPDKHWIFLDKDLPLYAIEDWPDVEPLIQPQEPNEHGSFHPADQAFVFANTTDHFFVVEVAMDPKGRYFFGVGLYEPETGKCGYPNLRFSPMSLSLKECLVKAMEETKTGSIYASGTPYPLYVRAATEALRKVEEAAARQLSLFDFDESSTQQPENSDNT